MTAHRCRDDMIERSDSAERIEATLAKDPMANAEANDPIEPMDRNDPTLPTDRIEFFDPIDRIEFSDRIEHQLPWLVTNEDYGSRQRRRYSGSLRRNRGGSRSGWTPTASPRTPPKSADASDETVRRGPTRAGRCSASLAEVVAGGLR